MTTAELIRQMTDCIVREIDPLRIVLFGSHARDEAGERSDIDLLVVLPDSCDKRVASDAIHSALRGFRAGADVVVTTPTDIYRRGHLVGSVLRSALHEGKVLYDMDGDERLETTRRWVRFAEQDLDFAARTLAQEEEPRYVCWNAQQAAEKAIKSIYVFLQLDYPFIHDLDELRERLPDEWTVKNHPARLKDLSEWAAQSRYPNGAREPTAEDAARAVELARAVFEEAMKGLREHGYEDDA